MKTISINKKLYHDYQVYKTYQAGMMLLGYEVKAIKQGKISLVDSFISIRESEAYIHHLNISRLREVDQNVKYNPVRERKLLLNKSEIIEIEKEVKKIGYTVVPLKIGIVRGRVKLDIALVKGLKQYDKREKEKLKSANRDIELSLKDYSKK